MWNPLKETYKEYQARKKRKENAKKIGVGYGVVVIGTIIKILLGMGSNKQKKQQEEKQ